MKVTDPQQIGEGRNAHTFYRIDVRQGQYSDPIASVRRRYSDFQWLFQRLHAEKPGAIVPIIPHTLAVQISKRLSEELVEERRVYLEGFLRRVQVHPELEGAPSLAAFFSPDAEVFEEAICAWDNSTTDNLMDKTLEFYSRFYLQDNILTKVDRASMMVSLEVRAPFLDNDVVEFARKIPHRYKYRNGQTKYLLKRALEPVLPRDTIYRKKKGFGVPLTRLR